MAKKKSFMDKLVTRTTDKTATKLADKISSGIVKGVTTKPKAKPAKPTTVEEKPKTSRAKTTTEAAPQKSAEPAVDPNVAMRYNTKRCPNCQGICFNSPADCPSCFQDLRKVKPLTPKEFDELNQ